MPDVDGDERVAFKLEVRPVQRIGDGIVLRDLAREPGQPECLQCLGRGPLAHALDDCRRCDGPHAGEALADRAEPEPVVTVPVGDVHRGEAATAMPCTIVMRGSTRTASFRPQMRVAEIGLQVERLWPGGTSWPAIAMIGVT